jgi:hypothetical protein
VIIFQVRQNRLQAVEQQIGHAPGGMSVFPAKRVVIQADPEGQQNGHHPKHTGNGRM